MARLDTGWHKHPRILGLGLAAMGLHAWSISYCDAALSDGFIPTGAWPSLSGVAAAVKVLVAAELWLPVEGGYKVHDYTDYNRTRAQVDAYMAAKIEAGRAGGLAKARASATAGATASARADGKADALANGQQMLYQKPTPGPGPGVNSPAGSSGMAGRISKNDPGEMPATPAHARTREPTDFQPLGKLLLEADFPDEIRERLSRPPIGQPAEPASPSTVSQETTTGAVS